MRVWMKKRRRRQSSPHPLSNHWCEVRVVSNRRATHLLHDEAVVRHFAKVGARLAALRHPLDASATHMRGREAVRLIVYVCD